LESLKQLESKVGEFLKVHERLQQTCAQLQLAAKEQEKQLAEAAGRLKQFEKERDEVRARLDRVLKQLEVLNLK
jgi:septal ring factor EnvC (AmiA/AmiB activator)